MRWFLACVAAAVWMAIPAVAWPQLRIGTYNISNYDGTNRAPELKTVLYGVFEGRKFAPDVLVCQEFLTSAALNAFVTVLNTAIGSPGDWAAAPFVDGADTESVLCYRTSKVQLLAAVVVSQGSTSPGHHPRNIMRYDVRLLGYGSEGAALSLYSTHMKAGSSAEDQSRRLVEAIRIRDDAESLPAGRAFALGGDFNISSSSEAAYVELVGSQINNLGRLFDPIQTPGSWGGPAFRFVHTQDPVGGGGMDDRYDQILLSAHLIDDVGMDYRGDPAQPYAGDTWNDPNHSYRVWGNDGTSYNTSLTVAANAMVGPAIASALIQAGESSGHLPVFLELLAPPRADVAPAALAFGRVLQGMKPPRMPVSIGNSANVALWSPEGIAPLRYSFAATPGLTVPSGTFTAFAGQPANLHFVALSTARPGPYQGTVYVNSDDPDQPVRTISVTGYVIPRFR